MDFTFEQLPQAVKLLFEKLSSIEQILLDNNRSNPSEQHDVYISIKEAAKVANLSVTTLYGLVSQRTIPHMKKGKRLYFSKLELNQWIREGRIKTINEISSEAREIINAKKGEAMPKKDAYYFSHDSNAQDDPKCMVLIDQLGMEGYGIFWALIEKLRAEKDYTLPLMVSGSFAKRWGTSKEKVDTVIKNYGLFIIENDIFFSLRLKSSMEQKSATGRASAISRWSKNTPELMQSHASALPMHADALPTHTSAMQNDAIKGKEKKEKESKVEKKAKHLDCVFLTTNEFDTLNLKHGKAKTDWVIEKLNSYKTAHSKSYESDYGAINSWVLDEYESKHSKSLITSTHYSPPKIASK